MTKLDTTEVYTLYKRDKLDMPTLADRFGVNKSTIKYHIDKFEAQLEQAYEIINAHLAVTLSGKADFNSVADIGNLVYRLLPGCYEVAISKGPDGGNCANIRICAVFEGEGE